MSVFAETCRLGQQLRDGSYVPLSAVPLLY